MERDGTWKRKLTGLALAATLLAGGEASAVGFAKKPTYTPSGEWEAFFRNQRGVASPVLQPLEQIKDKEWMNLQYTDFSGPKIRLAVMGVENKTATAEQASGAGDGTVVVTSELAQVPVASLSELLTTSLMSTHRFEVLERKGIESILSEQDLGASGRMKKDKTAAQTGKLIGAEYLLFASVHEWTPEKSKTGGATAGIGKGVLGLVGAQRSSSEIAMSLRVVDATSGQVLFSTTERASTGSWGIGLGGGDTGGGGLVGYKKESPIGYAVQACINKSVYKVAMWLKDRPWSARVIKISGGKVYINAGLNSGVASGMLLDAVSQGAKVVDPETGLVLGNESETIGTLQIVNVDEKYAVASIMEGCKGLKAGDSVELKSAP